MRNPSLLILLGLSAICAWLFAERSPRTESETPKPPLSSSQQAEAKQAREFLTEWQQENPVPSQRHLKVVYWTPSDREPAARYRERLSGIMDHIQEFYRSEMERNGFGPLVFPLEKDENGLLKIYLVRGKKTFAHYQKNSGHEIREECLPTLRATGMDPNRETLLIFCNLATWDDEKKTFSHKSPYYAGGSHRAGNAWQMDSPELEIPNIQLTEPIITDGEYGRISLGKHNSIFIGGIAHELGHALSLPHNREAPEVGRKGHRALMGSGNQTYGDEIRNEGPGSHLQFAGALRLASQPLFSRSDKDLRIHARAEMEDLSISSDERSFTVTGKISGNVPVYGLVAYLDPEGGGDYDAHTVTAVPDAEGRFSLHCDQLRAGKNAELRILICHANGATNRRDFGYTVDQNGKPNIESLQTKLALNPLVKALTARDHSQVQAGFDHLHAKLGPGPHLERANKLAQRLVASLTSKEQKPASAFAADQRKVALSDIQPTEARVGYGRPAYDHLPNPDLLLSVGGQLHHHGLYAHAPSLYRYQLDQGWTKLTGTCGLADGFGGSCVFIIKVDGKEKFRSRVMKAGKTAPFSIDLAKAKTLELIVSDAGDGKASDWGVWVTPALHR